MACGSESPALRALRTRVQNKDSGEFVCRNTSTEMHVHLRQGRIAWAASAAQPPAFVEHLRSEAQIPPNRLRQVLERCHRERLSLSGALMDAGLTTLGGLRCALSQQIGQVINGLAVLTDAQHGFKPRNYDQYDARLTFELRDFLTADAHAPRPREKSASGLAGQVLLAVEGLLWAEVFETTHCTETAPHALAPRTSPTLVRDTLLDGADFAAVRTTRAGVMGIALSDTRSLWCRVSCDATFGGVVAGITSTVTPRHVPIAPLPDQPHMRWHVGGANPRAASMLREYMARSPDVLATLILHADGTLTGCGTGAVALETCHSLARRRNKCLVLPASAFAEERERPLDSLHVSGRSMVSGEGALWCFGTDLLVADGGSLWLFFRRDVSQGLGWAYLTSLSRALTLDALHSSASLAR